ncbi:MAG TPA: UDP-glucuronic acid decarboxylase family protein [Methanoregulaceae archaeon]|nr:UDP-glucuronic acid decarboxylase family protein [Methanoregulaceae archaeon]
MASDDVQVITDNLGEISFEGIRVLVTGGSGFLGSWLCETILAQDGSVVCLDNFSSSTASNIKDLKKSSLFKLMNHDVSHPIVLDDPVDLVIHMASRASPFEFDKFPIQIIRSNTLGTINALEIAKQYKVPLLFTSTSETYGDPMITPTPETYRGNVNTLGIRGCYDEAKRAGEAICMAYYRESGIDVRIARIFNTYGPRMRGDGFYGRVVPRFIDQALKNEPLTIFGDGTQTRSFCYITDQVEGLIRLALTPKLTGEAVNIGNPNEITINELAKRIIAITGSESSLEYYPLPEDDPKRRCPDITKAKRLLQWRPKVDLDSGLKKMIDSYRTS